MNGAQTASRATSHQAQKSAEALFQSRNIAGIKEVERQTRQDIEAKKVALRQLVGDSYHDLIHAADIVVDMAASCQTVTQNISHIQEVFNDLALTLSGPSAGQRDFNSGIAAEKSELYALGSRVKYLVDTPEAVWGYLDAAQPLAAARRHLRAECVYGCLDSSKATLRKRFPLLKAQYPAIHQQKKDIAHRVHAMLAADANLPQDKIARALATMCLLEGSDSEAALSLLLNTRKQFLLRSLDVKESLDLPTLTLLLKKTAHSVQSTLLQVVQLFMESNSYGSADMNGEQFKHSGSSVLQQAAQEDKNIAAELMFDPLPPSTSGQTQKSEVTAWREASAALEARITPLSVDRTAPLCAAWLKELSSSITASADRLLEVVNSCAQLAEIETAVTKATREWSGAPLASNGPNVSESEGRIRWDDVSESALGRRAAMWPEVFELCLVQRANTLVSRHFASAVTTLEAPVSECVQLAGAGSAETPGFVATSGSAWREGVDRLAAGLDESLRDVLLDVMTLLPKGHPGRGGALTRARSLHFNGVVMERRVSTLQQQTQDSLSQAAQHIAQKLQSILTSLPDSITSGSVHAPSRVVEQALVIGRLAELIGQESSSLAVILGPPEEWSAFTSSTRFGSSASPATTLRLSRTHRTASNPRLEPIASAMRSVSRQAFQVWATWAASGLSDAFATSLAQEAILRSRVVPPNWEETVVESQEDSNAVDAIAIRFCLPAQPTTATLCLLMQGCNELQRAGGSGVPRMALSALAFELQTLVLRCLRTATVPGGPLAESVTEKGVLQLLFDARCLRDALASSAPLTANADEVKRLVAALRGEGTQLETHLCGLLDPIDWATYEPYLWAGQARCMQQKSLMFGLLMQHIPGHEAQLDKLHAQSSKQGTFLDMGEPCKHLPLLPIAMPNVQSAAQPLTQTIRTPSSNNTPALAATSTPRQQPVPAQGRSTTHGAPATDLVEAYSFANLTMHRPAVEDVGSTSTDGGGMAAAAMSTLESLGARFSDSTAAFGSMNIGLDVSAMQQQLGSTFGNVLQPNVLSTSIFSFGKQT